MLKNSLATQTIATHTWQLLTNSNIVCVFIVLYLFGLSIVAFGLMWTPLFTSSKVRRQRCEGCVTDRGWGCSLFFSAFFLLSLSIVRLRSHMRQVAGSAGALATSLFSLTIFGLNQQPPPSLRWLLSLVSPCAAAQALDAAILLDEEGPGVVLGSLVLSRSCVLFCKHVG